MKVSLSGFVPDEMSKLRCLERTKPRVGFQPFGSCQPPAKRGPCVRTWCFAGRKVDFQSFTQCSRQIAAYRWYVLRLALTSSLLNRLLTGQLSHCGISSFAVENAVQPQEPASGGRAVAQFRANPVYGVHGQSRSPGCGPLYCCCS